MARYATTDVHGCLQTLRYLVEQELQLTPDDELFLLGDYVNKGPDSRGVLDYLMHLQAAGYSVRVPAELPAVQAVRRLSARSYGREPFILPVLGGSLPLFHFVDALGATVITVPIVNADNSQHAPNENLRVRNLWDGIALMAELMAGLGTEWPAGAPLRPNSEAPASIR